MKIQHEDDGNRGRFFIEQGNELVAEIIYSWTGKHELIIHHTNVDEELEGNGIGKKLVQKVVELAREKGSKILPLCVFAKAVIERTPEFQDVLKNG